MRSVKVLAVLVLAGSASAQSWDVLGGSIATSGTVSTIPGGVLPFAGSVPLNPNPGLGPNALTVFNRAILRNPQFCGPGLSRCLDVASAGGWARVDADGPILDVRMVADARLDHTCPIECCLPWDNTAELDTYRFELELNIVGVAPGTMVDVSWSSDAILSVFGRHESGFEDPIMADPPGFDITYDVGGGATVTDPLLTGGIVGVIDNPFNMTLTSKILQQGDGSSGVIQVEAGTVVTIVLTMDNMFAHHEPDGGPIGPKPPGCPIGWSDGDGAELFTKLRMEIGSTTPPPLPGVNPPPPFGPSTLDVEFSLDIGSDAELSENLNPPPGRPQFDPGDMYEWQGIPFPPGGGNGSRDDALGLGLGGFITDPDPNAGLFPPLCSFMPPPINDFNDLDGFDAIDFSLRALLANGLPPFNFFASNTVFEPDTIIISVDDDSASDYAQCDVPINSMSPGLRTYGQSSLNDEVMELDVTTPFGLVPGALATTITTPMLDESDLHFGLGPNPDPFDERFDDDVDALDVNWDSSFGQFWIMSFDHEASAGFDPGAIYQTTATGLLEFVAGPSVLGLNAGVDIDALELCWLPGPQGLALAALFSVDDDDPGTPEDESGGLNPGLIYCSFFDGVALEFADWSHGDDIDAIAVWHRSIVATFTPCTGDIADSFGFLNPDGQVGFGDFLAMLGLVGPCPGGIPGCIGDIADGFGFLVPDGVVDFGDFLAMLGLVGPCP